MRSPSAALPPTLIFTGQHPRSTPPSSGLAAFPRVAPRLPRRRRPAPPRRAGHAARCCRCCRDPPDLLVVQGDTSSALGAALAGFTAGVPVAHVEAGLRTHDPLLPWPEEEYRTAIDARADLLFAPTETRRRQPAGRAGPRRDPRHRQHRHRRPARGRSASLPAATLRDEACRDSWSPAIGAKAGAKACVDRRRADRARARRDRADRLRPSSQSARRGARCGALLGGIARHHR